ncbi:integrase family protein [Ammonifex degensii KC4]|uniref:Integrase family protein n=1 Tax=Ammonifex degensii (strain DSM 10501 / KC4) TaxID=429009 RepID=C9R7L9_AMMDK|nr:tyrosine-type recombinase/integrase [Ammonifex degensii]ACX52298.1 integrase family protein [Ammonifex degensii KC4]
MTRLTHIRLSLPDLLEEFLLARKADGLAELTLSTYRKIVTAFVRFCGPLVGYEELRRAAIRYFARPSSPGYHNIKLRHLKAFFNWCVREGHLPANPLEGIRKAKEDLSRVRHAPLEALKRLLAQPDRKTYAGLRDYCLLLTQLDTGARPGELLRVTPSDLNLAARELHIRPEVAKTRVGRTLVVSPLTAQALARLLRARPSWWGEEVPLFASETGKPMNPTYWAERVREYCQRAGVKVTPYGLRHTFALEFLKASNDPFALQRVLGHRDLSMTRRYVRYLQEDVRQIHEKASPVVKLQQMGRRAPRKLDLD